MTVVPPNTVARLDFPRYIPFVEHLGMELWGLEDGKAELRLNLDQAHMNSMLVAHGGVVMTMLDVAMAHAARSRSLMSAAEGAAVEGQDALTAATQGSGVVTIEMKTTFMRGAAGVLRAIGTLLQRTTSMACCEAHLIDDAGRLCAHATGTFKYVRGGQYRAERKPTEEI